MRWLASATISTWKLVLSEISGINNGGWKKKKAHDISNVILALQEVSLVKVKCDNADALFLLEEGGEVSKQLI